MSIEVVTVIRAADTVVARQAGGDVVIATPGAVQVVQVGIAGPQGIPGPGAALLTIVAAETLTTGQPLYVDLISGQLKRADASAPSKSAVIGLCDASTSATFAAPVQRSQLTLADWSAITGSASLAVGQSYFLQTTPGTLGTTAPSTPGATALRVGIAVTPQTLEVNLSTPVLL